MKIVAVMGSPRVNGNSAFIAGYFLDAARRLGAETRSFALNKLSYRGCQACMCCKKTSEVCVLKDDLTEVLEAVREADVIVLASPVYYADVSGQLKLFIDRTYSYLTPDFHTNPNGSRLSPGKVMVFVQTQGFDDPSVFADVFPRYSEVMKFIGIQEAHLLRGCGFSKPDDAARCEELLRQTEALAAGIMGGKAAQG